MKLQTITAAAAALLLMGTVSASALTYAISVTPQGGSTVSLADRNSDRTDAANALGAPDADGSNGFFSLGLGRYADFTFGGSFSGFAVGDLYEVTNGNVTQYPEFADIYIYNSAVGESSLVNVASNIRNTTAQGGAPFSFSGTWDTLRIQDVTVDACNTYSLSCNSSASGDGFDIDAVGVDALASGPISAVPLPGAAWLLLGASGGLFAAMRRKSRKAA